MANVIEYRLTAVDKITGVTKKVGRSLKDLAKTTAKMTAAAGATGAAVFAFAKRVTEAQDRAAKFANRIGATTEQLTALEYAAERSGVATAQFDMAAQRMTRRVAEAAQGTGEAVKALQELGINARSFNTKDLQTQMEILSDRFANVQTNSEKVRLAFKLFDSEGVAMLQMLGNGSEAMRELARDAEFLGIVISSKAAANAEKFQDQLTRVGGAMRGVGYALMEDVVPLFTAGMETLANWIAANRDNIVNFAKAAVRNLLIFGSVVKQIFDNVVRFLTADLDTMIDMLSGFLDNVGKFAVSAGRMFLVLGEGLFTGLVAGVQASVGILNDFGAWLGKSIYRWVSGEDAPDFSEALAESMTSRLGAAAEKIKAKIDELAPEFNDAGASMGEAVIDGLGISLEQAEANVNGIVEKFTGAAVQIAEKSEEIAAQGNERFIEQYDSLKEAFDAKYSEWLETNKSKWEAVADWMKGTIENVSDTMGTMVSDAIVYGKDLGKAFQEMAKSVLASLIKMLVKWYVERKLKSMLGNALVRSEGAAEGAKAVGLAGANMFASWAAAPWPLSTLAPAMAAAAQAGTAAIFASGKAIGAAIGGADSGMDYVPQSGTYVLKGGERVIQPEQNRDLTRFLEEGGGAGGNVTIETLNVEVLPNATNAEALLKMDKEDMTELVAGPIIEALNQLDTYGIRPVFAERG